jgi:hypothetical protein
VYISTSASWRGSVRLASGIAPPGPSPLSQLHDKGILPVPVALWAGRGRAIPKQKSDRYGSMPEVCVMCVEVSI